MVTCVNYIPDKDVRGLDDGMLCDSFCECQN